jgi:hypothetical protein
MKRILFSAFLILTVDEEKIKKIDVVHNRGDNGIIHNIHNIHNT